MATIELDIIKQRSDKLLPTEKLDLIHYLAAGLSPEERAKMPDLPDIDIEELADDEPKVA